MNKRLETVIERGNCIVEDSKELEVSICGNGILEPGEECDCGIDVYHCDDPCCYPANISLEERRYNKRAIPCYVNKSHLCVKNSPLIFGVYVPFTVIILVTLIFAYILKQDWAKDKQLFRHVTDGNIRIVSVQR